METRTLRVDALHRRLANDVEVMYDAVSEVFPVHMPGRYRVSAMNLTPFLNRLNAVTTKHNVFNEIKEDDTILPGTLYMSGLWISGSELPENGSNADVRLIWHVAPQGRRIEMTQTLYHRRRFFFWTVLMHELVHRHQETCGGEDREIRVYNPRTDDRDLKENQRYYGNCDEIEAHAHDAAVEMFTWWPTLTFSQAVRAARDVSGPVKSTFTVFMDTFKDTPGHPAVPHFKRKLRSWYDCIQKNANFYRALQLPTIV